jgi:hypothetical protein
MNYMQIAESFSRSPMAEQIKILSGIAHLLTIEARYWYGETAAAQTSREINEILHLISGQISKIADADPKRYDDQDFFEILAERTKRINLSEKIFRYCETKIKP